MRIDSLDNQQLDLKKFDIAEKLEVMNKYFTNAVKPENNMYGLTEVDLGNGITKKTGKNILGHTFQEYYRDGSIYKIREHLGNHEIKTTDFDDNGNAYLKTTSGKNGLTYDLTPNMTVVKGNFSATIDAFGRPVLNKVTDLKLNTENRVSLDKLKDASYKADDHGGHLIAHQFGGTSTKENIVAQLDEVNLSKMKRVENIVKDLKNQGHSVDYEVRSNYVGSKNKRPSSFEPKITVDGQEFTDLPDDLKKIYNDGDVSIFKKATTTIGEKFGVTHELSKKSGLVAAGITFSISTVDNVSGFIDGKISAEEMVVDITKDTVSAGALGYGTQFITTTVSQSMTHSSSTLIKTVGGSCLPAAAVSFAVDSYDSVTAFAKGEIDGAELAYDLGESAATVAGSFVGGAAMGAAVGTIAGPIGTVAGTVAGGVVGCVVASEAYVSAVELGAEGVEVLAEQAENLAQGTVKLFEEHLPEKVTDIKSAFNDFFNKNNVPIAV